MKILHLLIFSCLIIIELKCTTKVKDETEKRECICSDLVLDELYNHYYLEDRNIPFSGTCMEYYKNGKMSEKKQLKMGKCPERC